MGGSLVNVNYCNLTIMNTTFEDNYNGYHGGAVYFGYEIGVIHGSTFVRNSAAIHAGAVKLENSNVTIEAT